MFNYIKGKVTLIIDGGIVLENNGIGYEIFIPDSFLSQIVCNDEHVQIFTFMQVREDDISLFGFQKNEDLKMFKKLLNVNGIGAKAALSILSSFSTFETQKLIILEDFQSLTKAQGIGKKTAQRIVLELKDKLGDLGTEPISTDDLPKGKNVVYEAIDALIELGYSKVEATDALKSLPKDEENLEDVIKYGLKNLLSM